MGRDRAARPEAKPLRLFVAIEIPGSVKDVVEQAFAPWREAFPKARWVPRENLHVTLKFLGRTWPRLADRVPEQVEAAAADVSRFAARLREVGSFPSAKRGRALWAGFEDGRLIADLAAKIEAGLVDARGPLLLLGTSRPDLGRGRAAWRARGRAAETLWLEPLSSSDTTRMLEELVPAELPAELRDVVTRRAEGNPFFLEELVRTLIDRGVLTRTNGGWTASPLSEDLVIPDTVHAVVAARIDLLDSAEKAALQAAAVIGRTFWSSPVYELLEGVEPDLRLLEERDFIRHRSSSALLGEREFVIKHAVTREVAYESLPRAHLHARFADWLERVGEGRDEHAVLLAHHYADAARPEDVDLAWQANDDELGRIRLSAVRWLRRAAELAIGRYEMTDGLSLLHRAVELESGVSGRSELLREIARANALYFDGEGFSSAMRQAIELTDSREVTGDLYAELAFQTLVRSGMWRVLPDPVSVERWIDLALELATPETAARAKALIARCYHDYRKSPQLAAEASGITERLLRLRRARTDGVRRRRLLGRALVATAERRARRRDRGS